MPELYVMPNMQNAINRMRKMVPGMRPIKKPGSEHFKYSRLFPSLSGELSKQACQHRPC